MPAMATDALGLMRHAERTLGSFFWTRGGFGRSNLYCLLPDVFSIFKNKFTTSTYMQDVVPDLFGSALIAQDGAAHHHLRSAMNTPFLPRGLSAAQVGAMFGELIERRVRSWRERPELQILAETRELVLAGMFKLLGVPESDLSSWRKHYETFMLLAINLPLEFPGSPRRRGLRSRAWLDEHLMAFIEEARRNPDTPGLLAALVHARDEEGGQLTDRELVDNLRLLVLAGHETSASTMAWMVVMLAQHPEAWDALCAEAVAAGAVPQTSQDLKNLPYAEAVFRETLRLHPPVATDARRALVDFELAGRPVKAGTMVGCSIIHLSRHSTLYERPDDFVPQRWVGRNESVSPVELVQFGGGPHFCLGYHLAWLEIVQFAVALALTFHPLGARPRLVGRPPRMRYLPLLHPSAGTRVKFA
jgi:cytochrome P450 family 117 subfamily A